jgi:hypothetical protein
MKGREATLSLAAVALFASAGCAAFADAPVASTASAKMATGTAVGQRIPSFQAKAEDLGADASGPVELDSQKRSRATAYVFVSQTCPFVSKYRGRLRDLTKSFASSIDFVMVYPVRKNSAASKKNYHRKEGFSALFLDDSKASLAKKLKISRTPEIVLTSAKGEIVFRGGIDDNPFDAKAVKTPHFANALAEVSAGKPVQVPTARTYG